MKKVSLTIVALAVLFVPTAASAQGTGIVTRAVDGDTLKVEIGGSNETVRLIGVDTPETVHPRQPVQCFGQEASTEVARLTEGKEVRLEKKENENADRYGRLLRYVYVPQTASSEAEIFLNEYLIREGYGFAYLEYPFAADLMERFRGAEAAARQQGRGLWAAGACAGEVRPAEKAAEDTRSAPAQHEYRLSIGQILRAIMTELLRVLGL